MLGTGTKTVPDRCRILIVDPFDREGSPIGDVFDTRSAFDVVWAADARSAARVIDRGDVRVVISEFCLPDETAAQMCRHLSLMSRIDKFFVYSAFDRDIDRTQAIDSGAADFFVIPDDIKRLELATIACFPQLRLDNPFTVADDLPTTKIIIPKQRPRSRPFRRRVGGII